METQEEEGLSEEEMVDTCRFIIISELAIQLNQWVKTQSKIVGDITPKQVGRALNDVTDKELMSILMSNDEVIKDRVWFAVTQQTHEDSQNKDTLLVTDEVQVYNEVYSGLLKLEDIVDFKDKEHITCALSSLALASKKV